ncbi:MAG: hypothetical protein J6Y89_06675 [Lachnospiraceae bacterium]|nr:hypothetical protein [Lachnospiraceae bacterium]
MPYVSEKKELAPSFYRLAKPVNNSKGTLEAGSVVRVDKNMHYHDMDNNKFGIGTEALDSFIQDRTTHELNEEYESLCEEKKSRKKEIIHNALVLPTKRAENNALANYYMFSRLYLIAGLSLSVILLLTALLLHAVFKPDIPTVFMWLIFALIFSPFLMGGRKSQKLIELGKKVDTEFTEKLTRKWEKAEAEYVSETTK